MFPYSLHLQLDNQSPEANRFILAPTFLLQLISRYIIVAAGNSGAVHLSIRSL